jgi:hypothetical protein
VKKVIDEKKGNKFKRWKSIDASLGTIIQNSNNSAEDAKMDQVAKYLEQRAQREDAEKNSIGFLISSIFSAVDYR